MKQLLWILLLLTVLAVPAQAAPLPESLQDAIPEEAEELLDLEHLSGENGLREGFAEIGAFLAAHTGEILQRQAIDCLRIFAIAALCSLLHAGVERHGGLSQLVTMIGAILITELTGEQMDSLLGLGKQTIHQLTAFSDHLLPALAAATAAAGGIRSATIHQLTAGLLTEVLIRLMDTVLLPLVSLYTGTLTAAVCLRSEGLRLLANGMRKAASWGLCTMMLLFTGYLSTVHAVSAGMDRTAVKLAKATITGAVPVVGKIVSEATETVLSGALMLRNTIGVLGMMIILATCAVPFLRLGIQYLLYKLTACLSSLLETPELAQLINGLGSAFGLVLGMTGSCAMLLFLSVISCISAVVSS